MRRLLHVFFGHHFDRRLTSEAHYGPDHEVIRASHQWTACRCGKMREEARDTNDPLAYCSCGLYCWVLKDGMLCIGCELLPASCRCKPLMENCDHRDP